MPCLVPRLLGLSLALALVGGPVQAIRAQDASPVATPAADAVAFVWETRGGPDMPLDQPNSIALDPQGNLWVLDGRHRRFEIFAPDGEFLKAWGAPGGGEGQFDFVVAHGLALGDADFDAAGNLYVVDSGNLRIQKFDPNRRFVTAWGEGGSGDGTFLRPVALGLGPDGRVYVADDGRMDVQVFDADGAYQFTFGGPGSGDGKFVHIGRVAVAPDGSILVGDLGANRLQRFAADGTFLEAWSGEGTGEGQVQSPTGITVDDQGRVYVADASNHRVQVFAPDGTFLTAWGSEGTGEGQFDEPAGVALDGQGHVYVSDYAGDRVQKFRLLPPLAAGSTPTP